MALKKTNKMRSEQKKVSQLSDYVVIMTIGMGLLMVFSILCKTFYPEI